MVLDFRSTSRLSVAALLAAALLVPKTARAQSTGQVQGRVTDATFSAPLSSVQVSIVGTGLGALADNAGRFQISGVPPGPITVRAELIGYSVVTQELEIGPGETVTLNMVLRESAIAMDEIVVTGTPAATSRRQIGNAIAQVDVADVVEQAAITNVNELLTARVAGSVVMSQSGNLGSGAPIRLRGDNSLSLSGQPIIYVDGVRVDADASAGGIFGHTGTSRLSDFNPNEIESIEILKGPAASTLYGTEASNGVIQIITKKGIPGTTVIDFTMEQGANWLRDPEGRIPVNCDRDATDQLICQNLIADEGAAGRPVFRTGHIQSYDLSVRGGEGNIGYFISGEFSDAQGYYRNNSLTQNAYRANVNAELSEELNVAVNLGYVTSENPRHQEGFSGDQGIIANTLFATPLTKDTPTRGFLRGPPEESNEILAQQDVNRFTFSVQANHQPFEWFTHRLNAGMDITDARNTELWPRQPEGSDHFFGASGLGQRSVEERENRHVTFDYAATGTLSATDQLSFATSVGAQYFTTESFGTTASGREFPSPEVTTVSSAAVTSSGESFVENSTLGVYVQESLSWRDRFFLTGAVRADDNSAFGKDFDVVTYPKISGSWTVSSEPFFDVGFVDDLNLRAAWGKAGQQPSAFAAVRTFSPFTGEGDGAGFLPSNPGNPDLKPETGTEIEAGFDASMLGGRLGMSMTWYNQSTTDAIVNQDVPPSTGFPGSQTVNLGRIENWGLEMELNTVPIATSNLELRIGANMALNENEIVELGGPTISAGGFGTIQHREGFALGSFFAKKAVSATLNPDGTYDVLCDGGTGKQGAMPGGAPVDCADAPEVLRGIPGPRWSGSVNAGLTLFGNLRLAATSDIRLDQYMFNITGYGRDAVFRNSRKVNDPGPEDIIDLAEWDAVGSAGPWVENHSFVILREVSVAFAFPEQWAARYFRADRAQIMAALRNPGFLWISDDYTDVDPDVMRGSSTISKDQQTLSPQATRFVVSLHVTF